MTKKKILVVDDAESLLYTLKTVLELNGYEATTANSGSEALKKLEETNPDLILLDIMMPDGDGWELSKKIREKTKSKIPIVFMTARADEMSKKLSEEIYKADGYITKPFLDEDLLKLVKKLIG